MNQPIKVGTGFQFPKKRFVGMIYSAAGTGKTISAMTALKVPDLKVRVLCTETNALTGIEEALEIHGITDLQEGQLTIAIAQSDASSLEEFQDQSSDAFYRAITGKLFNFIGHDVATGKEVKLGKVQSWGKDTLFILDGMTMFESSCAGRGMQLAKAQNNAKDARAVFYAGQKVLVGAIFAIAEESKGHILVLAHQAMSDDVAMQKYKLTSMINPGFGTRSVIDKLAGRFSSILYMRYNAQQKKYVWSAEEKDAYTISRGIDRVKLKKAGINLNNLPADFSHAVYDFFK
jgi:hypothetical protein